MAQSGIGATFADAYLRNADFEGADLANADFTDADWFNAAGLTFAAANGAVGA